MNQDTAKPRELAEFVDDLVRIGTAELNGKFKLPEADCRVVMASITDQIVTLYARTTMYVPAGFGPRNKAIWDKYQQNSQTASAFTQDRVAELAVEYQLTTRQIYSILAVMKHAEMARRQSQLPGFDSPE
ncbi:MAG: Mor transcription activator family protein [Rubrivivax sp.]|nr:Mor transcription activator family protein [Rubrivivax sp.]MDP3612583.1 Mor transcription activator family protein [Rubrivivax sp.]